LIKGTTGSWAEWPICPQCHERREAQCTGCSAHGTDFRLADFDEPDDAEEGGVGEDDVLLLCSTCDEPFAPRFYRRCAECGHDFGAGIEGDEIVREEFNSRVVLVIVAMLLLLGGLLAFFVVVLQ
jgi:hypothetical protein